MRRIFFKDSYQLLYMHVKRSVHISECWGIYFETVASQATHNLKLAQSSYTSDKVVMLTINY